MTRHAGALVALVALAACVEATQTEQPTTYGFAIPYDSTLSFVFHWTPASLPVRIWAEPTGELGQHVEAAIRVWEDNARYGEFRGVMVRDSSTADVIFTLANPVVQPRTRIDELGCHSYTRWAIALDTTIVLPFHPTLAPRVGFTANEVSQCIAILAARELGATLGLLLASDDTADLMSGRPHSATLSARDRETFLTLYHMTPTVGIPHSRH